MVGQSSATERCRPRCERGLKYESPGCYTVKRPISCEIGRLHCAAVRFPLQALGRLLGREHGEDRPGGAGRRKAASSSSLYGHFAVVTGRGGTGASTFASRFRGIATGFPFAARYRSGFIPRRESVGT